MAAEQSVMAAARPAAGKGLAGYSMMYRLGITPWDHETMPPELVNLVQGPQALPPGRALDLGCGLGQHTIFLASHGWQATGVDYVPRALATARRRAQEAGVEVRWIEGDVTRLPDLGIGGGYTLLLDAGCLHGLDATARAAYAEGIGEAAAPGAVFLLFAFAPAFRGPAPRGLSRDEVLDSFGGGWQLVWDHPDTAMKLPGPLRHARPAWYFLRRR